MKQERTILMAGGVFWPSPVQVGDQHLARLFLESGWRVGFLSMPVSPLHLLTLRTPELKARYRNWRIGGQHEERLWYYVPGAIVVPNRLPFLRSLFVYRHWFRFTLPNLRRVLRNQRLDEVELLYLRDTRYSFLLDNVRHAKSFFRYADQDSGFAWQMGKAHATVQIDTLKRVSHVCYTAKQLEAEVKAAGVSKSMYLENGVSLDQFSGQKQPPPPDLDSIPRPIAIYVGSIADWFDFDLVRYAAQLLPKVSFVLIGHPERAKHELRGISNVYVLGLRPHRDIPAFLHNSSVGIIPFNLKAFPALVDAINPLKLYEYLAAGLPTVSVAWAELRRINPPSILAATREDFVKGIENYLHNPPSKKALADFAEQKDWRTIFAKLLQFLEVE